MSNATAEAGPLAVFRVTTRSRLARFGPHLGIAGIFGCLGLGFLAMAASRPETNTLSPGLVCFLGAVGTAVYVSLAPPQGARQIELDAEGFRWEDGAGMHRAKWDDVLAAKRALKSVVNGFVRSASTTLFLRGGHEVLLDYALEGYDELADLVQRLRATQVLLELLREVENGRPVAFGPLSVDRSGVECQGRHRPWGTFEYAFDSGRFVLVPAGDDFGWHDRLEVSVADVPDALALEQLLAHFQPPANPFHTIPPRDRERLARG
jgi:hypothetical protein